MSLSSFECDPKQPKANDSAPETGVERVVLYALDAGEVKRDSEEK